MGPIAWKVSLHGGHSGPYCEHAAGSLRDTLEAAVAVGFSVYGVTEHAPRSEARFLYQSERDKGFTVERLERDFEAYAAECSRLQREFQDRLVVLRGFESEVVPATVYADTMRALRKQYAFDYVVGSVHHVREISIDETPARFRTALEECGGLEQLFERYYALVAEMIEVLEPEVVAHFDLPRLHAPVGADLATPRIRRAAERALETARTHGCILDLNTAAWRKGLSDPYPAPWLVRCAAEAGLPFCFGDDSHRPSQVGFGMEQAREYLLANEVDSVTVLTPGQHGLARQELSLASK